MTERTRIVLEPGERLVPLSEVAIEERWCNSCQKPWKEWGPTCPGVIIGDYTHFHSPEFWLKVQSYKPTFLVATEA